MLEDSFPDMSALMRQMNSASFQARQRWEREALVKFSKTIRQHMRDPTLFTPEACWTPDESDLADTIIHTLYEQPGNSIPDIIKNMEDD